MHSPSPATAVRQESCKSMGCVFYLNSRDRERMREGRGREGERDGTRRKFAISKYFSEKGSAWWGGGEGGGRGKLEGWRDLNPIASSSHPGAIVILIRLFVISPPLIRPNSPCLHNASLSPFSPLSPRSSSPYLSFSYRLVGLIKTMSDWRQSAQTDWSAYNFCRFKSKKITLYPIRRMTALLVPLAPPENVHFLDLAN